MIKSEFSSDFKPKKTINYFKTTLKTYDMMESDFG